jgi:hypothetical protein
MYLLNQFGFFGKEKKNNLLPKLGSKLGGIAYGAKRQVQGAKEGLKIGINLGKKEFKRSGDSKIKNPVKVASKAGLQIGSKLGKAVGTVEGRVKGYKKGKELQDKLPKFSSNLLIQFAKKKKTNVAKDVAVGGVIGTGTVGVGTGAYYLNNIRRSKKGLKDSYKLVDIGRKGMKENHPDKIAKIFDDPKLQETAETAVKKEFQKYNNLKDIGQKGIDEFEPKYSKSYKNIIKDDAISTGKRIKSKVGKGVSLLKANKSKAALGLGALATGAAIANKLRKSRADKGKLRGKYTK